MSLENLLTDSPNMWNEGNMMKNIKIMLLALGTILIIQSSNCLTNEAGFDKIQHRIQQHRTQIQLDRFLMQLKSHASAIKKLSSGMINIDILKEINSHALAIQKLLASKNDILLQLNPTEMSKFLDTINKILDDVSEDLKHANKAMR